MSNSHPTTDNSLVGKFNLTYEYNVSWTEAKHTAKKQAKHAQSQHNRNK